MRWYTLDRLNQFCVHIRNAQFQAPSHAHHIAVAQELVTHVTSHFQVANLILDRWLRRHVKRELRSTSVTSFRAIARQKALDFSRSENSPHSPVTRSGA